jgi:hypothetical protein
LSMGREWRKKIRPEMKWDKARITGKGVGQRQSKGPGRKRGHPLLS